MAPESQPTPTATAFALEPIDKQQTTASPGRNGLMELTQQLLE